MRRYVRQLIAAVLIAAVLIAAGAVLALTGPAAAEEQAADPIAQLQKAIAERDQVIDNLLKRIETLERKVAGLSGTQQLGAPPTTEELAAAVANAQAQMSGEAPLSQEEFSPAVKTVTMEQQEQQELINSAFERTLIERGGLLLAPYSYEIQPGFSYVHSSIDRIVIDAFNILEVLSIGDIYKERVRRDSFLFSATMRLGLPWDCQAEVRIPYGIESQKIYTDQNVERNTELDGIGDVELALSHQLLQAHGWIPDLLGSVRWKTKTGEDTLLGGSEENLPLGTGYNSIQGMVTAVKVSDPVAFFGGFSYSYNMKETRDLGEIDPGDSFGGHIGMALSLNLDTSINFSYEQRYTWRTSLNGQDIPGSYYNTGTFSTGVSYTLDNVNYKSLDVSLGIGLTDDAPDVQFNVSLPMRYSF